MSEAFSSGYYGIKNNKDHPIHAFQCFICKTVHTSLFETAKQLVYDCPKPQNPFGSDDSWDIFWFYGKCELKALQYFYNMSLWNVTEEMFVNRSIYYMQRSDCGE